MEDRKPLTLPQQLELKNIEFAVGKASVEQLKGLVLELSESIMRKDNAVKDLIMSKIR